MDPDTPQWLTKQYIKDALENGRDYTIKIDDLNFNRPVAKGENYGSTIFGALVQYRKSNDFNKLHNISLIIKAPSEGPNYDYMIKSGVFIKESIVYHELSKKFKLIFGDDENDDVIPEAFPSSVENVIIIEDLKSKGYVMADRLKRYDYDHCALSFKTLAKFHAGSVIIHEKEPEFIENLGREGFFNADREKIHSEYMESNFKILAKVLKESPQLSKYSNWFDVNYKNAYNITAESLKMSRKEFNVLNHGDFWINNMLIKYDDNNVPVKIKLIDFQLTRYLSPAVDFWYFVDGCALEKVRTEKFDDLVDVYLNELNSELKCLGSSKRLERCDFKKSLKAHINFRIFSNFALLPMVAADPTKIKVLEVDKESYENLNVSNIDDNPLLEYFRNPEYLNLISKRLEELEEIGLITAE